jgi:RNA polymerase sigma-70 factor (ECF subfamily)
MGEMSSVTIDAEALQRLVAEAQEGDRAAADRLVREHQGWVRSAVYAVTGRIDLIEDIVQQVWVRAWERLGTLENPRRLRPWLYTVARNTAIDTLTARRREKLPASLNRQAATPDRQRKNPLEAAAGQELQATLVRAVQSLPAIYREAFVLRHLEDWSYAEIGEVLGLPVDTVETRLVRARRLLREMLQDKVEL